MGPLDNPTEYDCWYLSAEASGAVGESFGNLARWTRAMFPFPLVPGASKALGIFHVADVCPVLDLDDAQNLDRALRPTQVIIRNLDVTQAWALRIFQEKNADGQRTWQGVRWWSYQRPQWRVLGLWGADLECVEVQELQIGHPAVVDAATALNRPLS